MVHGFLKTSGKSEHVHSSFLGGLLKSTVAGLKSMRMQGDVSQQGAQFVLGPGDTCLFAHLDQGPLDHSPINTLLEAAGMERIDFKVRSAALMRAPARLRR